MQTLFIGFQESNVHYTAQGLSIRISYLLSSQFFLSGNVSYILRAEETFKNWSYERKLQFLEDCEIKRPNRNYYYQDYKDLLKRYKQNRAVHKEFIVYKNKWQKILLEYFDKQTAFLLELYRLWGFATLTNIQASPTFAEYYIYYENKEKEIEDSNKLSDILLLKLEEKDLTEPTIFVLNGNYVGISFEHGGVLLPNWGEFSEKGFLIEIFSFPDITALSVADIDILRTGIADSLINFQQHTTTFCTLHEKPLEAFDYINTHILPAAQSLFQHINNTELMLNFNTVLSNAPGSVKVDIGLVSHYSVFKYFEFIDAAAEETMTVLEQLPDDQKNKLVPVMIIRVPHLQDKEEEIQANAPHLLSTKKSLSID